MTETEYRAMLVRMAQARAAAIARGELRSSVASLIVVLPKKG